MIFDHLFCLMILTELEFRDFNYFRHESIQHCFIYNLILKTPGESHDLFEFMSKKAYKTKFQFLNFRVYGRILFR